MPSPWDLLGHLLPWILWGAALALVFFLGFVFAAWYVTRGW